jgi:DNA-binding SARP family transcriptional activator
VSERPQPRHALATRFCEETTDPLAALRWHLSRLRRVLDPAILVAEGESVRFNRQVAHVDSVAFERALGERAEQQDVSLLAEALRAYRGEFLSGLSLSDAPEFDFWLLGERARLQQLYEQGLSRLVEGLISLGQYAEAIPWAQRLVESEPARRRAAAVRALP